MTESFQILATLLAVQIALALAPGPNTLLVARAAAHSRARALAVVCGVWPIGILWAALGLAGLAALSAALPGLAELLRILGGLHLVVLGVKGVRRSFGVGAARLPDALAPTHTDAFRSGLLAHAANGRAIVYYMAVFAATGVQSLSLAEEILAVVTMPTVSALWNALSAVALTDRPRGRAFACRWTRDTARPLRLCLACDRD